jgi:hypothetical protein
MSLDQLALTIYRLASAERPSERMSVVGVLAAMIVLELWGMLILRRIFMPDDGDDPGSDGDGPGWRRRGPRTPPPDAPVCWPEFERQFAEYVAALGARASGVPHDRPAGGQRDDLIDEDQAFGPVGDQQDRASARGGEDVAQERLRGLGIQVGGRLVEDQHRSACEQGAGEDDPLALAPGQLAARLADARVPACGQAADPVPDARLAQRALDRGVAGVGPRE